MIRVDSFSFAVAAVALSLTTLVSPLSAQVTPGGTFTDKAIFTQSSGGETLTRATTAAGLGPVLMHDFDTSVAVDGSYELTAPSTIALSSGRHLVIYSTRFDARAGGATRAEIQTGLTLGGSALAAGRSQGYIRRSGGADETVMTGGAIIDVDGDGDVLTLESRRSDNNADATVLPTREPSGTSIQLLKLEDNWDYLSLELAISSGTVSAVPSKVSYDTNNSPGTLGTAFSFTATSGDITLNENGLYLVFANTGFQNNAANVRTNYGQRIILDGTEVLGSRTSTYVRGNGNNENARDGVASVGMIVAATAGQVMSIEIVRELAGVNGVVQGGQTALTVVKLPITTKYITLNDTTNQDILDATVDVVGFDTQLTPVNSTFSHSGGSEVTVNNAGDYLFLSSLFTTGDLANDNHDRTIPVHGWQIDGAGGAIGRGIGAQYNRDSGTKNSGSWAATLLQLTAGQTVEMTTLNLGTAPNAGTTILPNTPVLQALSIDSLVLSNDPVITVNQPLTIEPDNRGAITDAFLDTFDNDTLSAGLTYTVDSVPALGTLLNNGTVIGEGGSFTQADVDDGLITFVVGGSAGTGGFDFTVSDGSTSDTSRFVVISQFPITLVTIEGDGNVSEGGDTDFIITADVAPVGADLTVNLVYSGSATDGSDFTGVASVDILDGDTTAAVNIATFADGLYEGDEQVTASIGTMSGATVTPMVGTPGSASFLIEEVGNRAPTGTNLTQVVSGSGTVAISDIVVSDPDASYESSITTAGESVFQTNGIANLTIYSDGRPDAGSAHDVDAAGPALVEADGMSLEIAFIPQASDLTGVVDVWEIGGSSNGTSILLVDGVPHMLSKAVGGPADVPTDDNSLAGAFTDLDWATDDTIVVPLNGSNALIAGEPAQIAVIYDLFSDIVKSSVNGSAEVTTTLLNRDGTNWIGDHTSAAGTNAGTGTGGSNSGTGLGGVAAPATIKNLANGAAAVSSVRFWNEATGSINATAGIPDQATATLTISPWSPTSGSLTATSGNGETFSLGVWTVTGDISVVNAALAAVEFVTDVGTLDPTFIEVAIDDGDEDGGGVTAGAIAITATAPDPIYVDGDFSGSLGDVIVDADSGPAVALARFGIDAFQTVAGALAVVIPTGTIIVNDGDYSSENISLSDTVKLRLTDTAGPVQIGDITTGLTNSIDLQSNTLEIGATNVSTPGIDSPIIGAGNLTKIGTGLLQIHALTSHTGTTTVSDGRLRIGQNIGIGLQSELSGDGPVVVNAPGRLEFYAGVDSTLNQTAPITGSGQVATGQDGTVIFDGAEPNTFTGGFELGDGAVSNFDGATGTKAGFVVVNHNGHLGSGLVLSRGGQLQAGTSGIVVPNDGNVTGGGFRFGGIHSFELSGDITTIDTSSRTFGNYGLEGLDIMLSGNLITTTDANLIFEGRNNKDNGSFTITADISGPQNVDVNISFDDGVITFSGAHTNAGTSAFSSGMVVFDATQTGGGAITVAAGATLAGTGSTTSAVTVSGILSPGGSGMVGTLTTGALTFNGAGRLEADLAGDNVIANGAVTINAGATLELGFTPAAGASPITILTNNDAGPVVGEFAGFAEGAAVDPVVLGWSGSVTYLQGGN
ncbi:MAG: autotransporter-associated beta strand protein, partial [Verrucomicrobiales bacterium]